MVNLYHFDLGHTSLPGKYAEGLLQDLPPVCPVWWLGCRMKSLINLLRVWSRMWLSGDWKRKIPKPIEMKMKERRESAEDVMQTDQSGSRTKEREWGKYVREDQTEIRCDSDSAENSGEFTANHLSVATFIAGETQNCRHVQIRPFHKAF